jgi:nucleotide sugar dehydrogenase
MTFQSEHVANFFGVGSAGLSVLEPSFGSEQADAARTMDALRDPESDRLAVAVVGLGYVGLPTALSLAGSGAKVLGIDTSTKRVTDIAAGDVDGASVNPCELSKALVMGSLELYDTSEVISAADAVIICVPTPVDSAWVPDVSALERACATVVEHAHSGQLIILTSTTYVGCTSALLAVPLAARGFTVGTDINVAFCPERLNPGSSTFAHDEVTRVIGGVTPSCSQAAEKLLGQISPAVHIVSSPEAAELSKLIENTFRAVNIALVNEFAEASRVLGVDAIEALDAAASKPYGFMAFQPGPGVGGHCIPCDPHYLLWRLRAERVHSPIIEQAMATLAARPVRVADRAGEVLASRGIAIEGARIALAGLAYKPGVQDVRESPALALADVLRKRGAVITAHDPVVGLDVRDSSGVPIANGAAPGPDDIDLAIVMTLHPGIDNSWLDRVPMVLDATYRMERSPAVVPL